MKIHLETSNCIKVELWGGKLFEIYDNTSGELEITPEKGTMEVFSRDTEQLKMGEFRHIRVK
jgi:hypothetical protein